MLIVLLVAGIALLAQLFLRALRVQVTRVAILAGDGVVLAFEHVFGIHIVVEGGGLPGLGAVAGFALLAVEALMTLLVVNLAVAGVTIFGRVFVDVVLVAVHTLHVVVLASEREFGGFVVELCLFPIHLGMAIGALGTKLAFVLVVFLVAGVAILRGFTVLLARNVALVASYLLMLALERVVGLVVVVELLLVNIGGFQVTALVVAVAALANHGLLQAAVKALLAAHIHAHRLVAVHAQAVLRLTVELDVALLAIVLILGMPLYQLARRHDGLDTLRLHCGCQRHRQAQATRDAQ